MTKRTRKPKLHTQAVHDIPKHDFKRHEWLHCENKIQLMNLIQAFRREFRVSVWSESDIRHFLSVFSYLYPEAQPREHHVRAVATLIRRLYP